jgi:hypothetical protein
MLSWTPISLVASRASRRDLPLGAAYSSPISMPAPAVEITSKCTLWSDSAASAPDSRVRVGAPPPNSKPVASVAMVPLPSRSHPQTPPVGAPMRPSWPAEAQDFCSSSRASAALTRSRPIATPIASNILPETR